MNNITGPPVTGDDFYGREEELTRLCRAVKAGNHVLLTAPRRVGKSSLVLRLGEVLAEDGWTFIPLDVQACSNEAEFTKTLLSAFVDAGLEVSLGAKILEKLRRFRRELKGSKAKVSGVEVEVGEGEAAVWKELAAVVEPALSGAEAKGRVLVALDELPIFLGKISDAEDGPRRAAEVLHWLRGIRHSTTGRATWVMAGSVGLDSFVERRGLQGTINDLTPQTLGAYSDETAAAFLKRLGSDPKYGLRMTDEVCSEIITRVGWPLPYYLQLLFCALTECAGARRAAPGFPTADDVAAAYEDLLQPHHRIQFGHWDSRLDKQFDDPADAGIARFLLSHICQRPRGCTRQKLLDLLVGRQPNADPDALERRLVSTLHLLDGDGYLLRAGDSYAFRAFLLRDYWKRWCV
jgi:hypothetical protein